EKKKLPVAYIAIAAVIVIGLIFILFPKGKDVTTPEKAVTEKAAQPPVSMQAETRVPEKSVAPEQVKKQEPVEDPQEKARALQEQAAGLMETQPQKAMPLLLEAVKADPENVQAHFHLGMVHMKLKDNAKAIDALKKAAELAPKFSDAYFNLGYIYAINKNYPKAEEMYEKVVKLSPSYLDEALFNLGIMQEKQGKRQQCIESIERAVKVNPGNQLAIEYLQKLKRKS
ncbi:MAG: tetratricopeptide repeat protein, partial [Nitrospirae bacterium]|nr:tetratricopeptide repeat protein [Nitrospirota bacterium]